MNSKLYNFTLPPPIRYLGKRKLCIWHCPMVAGSNRTVPNFTKMTFLITILLGAYYLNKLCMVEQPHHSSVFFGQRRGPIPVVCISVSSKILFLQAAIKTSLPIISGSSFQRDVLLSVLSDNSGVPFVKVHDFLF